MTTNIPGTFKWQAGVLTTAVSQGKWILFEDIDLAPSQVLSVIIPLLETRTLLVPSRGEKIIANDSFRVFATRKSKSFGKIVGDGLWDKICISPPSSSEILEIVKQEYPKLTDIAHILVDSYSSIVSLLGSAGYGSIGGSLRPITLRDLFKWCKRLQSSSFRIDDLVDIDLDKRELIFREAVDCFLAMISNDEFKKTLVLKLGECLLIPDHRLDFYVEIFTPVLNCLETFVSVGRVTIPKSNSKRIEIVDSFATLSHSLKLMEKLSMSIFMNEPVLLVGETGTGKTTIVQHLARLLNKSLSIVNMSQQSDSSDLLGGFKPVDAKYLATPLKDAFINLFKKTFSAKKNVAFLDTLDRVFLKNRWDQVCTAFLNGVEMANKVFQPSPIRDGKRVKTFDEGLKQEWILFQNQVTQFQVQLEHIQNKFLFSFVEGSLVRAVQNGDWVLLDEVNLASQETLECLSGLLQSDDGSLLLMEKGDTEPIKRHPDFRLFACMNPANDAGKRDLPPGLRSRFSEFWVDSPDKNPLDLDILIQQYIKDFLPPRPKCQSIIEGIRDFYNCAKSLSQNELFDGANHRVHFSIRTLSRALSYAASIAPIYGLDRALYEGMVMTFMTQINIQGQVKIKSLIENTILKNVKNISRFIELVPKPPSSSSKAKANATITDTHILFNSFWIRRAGLDIPEPQELESYVLTPSVETNLMNLARAVMSHNYPILIQGPTSAGKTSMIEYMAKRTGHRFVRINNHEHTDLQEYVGTYVADDSGKLVFRDVFLF